MLTLEELAERVEMLEDHLAELTHHLMTVAGCVVAALGVPSHPIEDGRSVLLCVHCRKIPSQDPERGEPCIGCAAIIAVTDAMERMNPDQVSQFLRKEPLPDVN